LLPFFRLLDTPMIREASPSAKNWTPAKPLNIDPARTFFSRDLSWGALGLEESTEDLPKRQIRKS